MDKISALRRKLLLGIATLPVSGLALAATRTPSAAEGPFYPTTSMRFDDIDNDLVKISGRVERAGGEIVRLGGRVLDRDGQPVGGARVEIWQCDVNGRYLHRADFGWSSRDPGFQGFGLDATDRDGHYSFRTIRPVPYTGRTPHIHVKVWVGGRARLTTQLYLPDHPDNEDDFLYQRIPPAQRRLVSMDFQATAGEQSATVDLII